MRAAFSGIGYGSVLTSGLPSQPAISQCFAQVTIPGNAAGAPPPPPNPPFTPPPPPPSLFDVIPQRSFATTASAHIQQPYGMKVETTSYWSTAGSFYDVGSMMHHPIPNAANGLPPTAEQRHLESNFGGQYCGSNAVTASFGQVPSLSCPQFGGNLQVIANSYSEFTNIIDPPPPPPVFDAPTSSEATVDRFTSQQYYEETSDGGDGYYADHYTDYCANSSKNSKRSPEELTMKESAASSAAKRKTLRKRKRSLRTVAAPAAEPAGFHEAREPAAHHSEEELHLRSRSQFTGRVYKLPENCRRPQTSAGRTFPLKARVDYAIAYDGDGPEFSNRNRQKYLYDSVTSVLEAHRKKDAWLSGCAASSDSALVIRTATKLVRKVPSSLLESNRSPARRGPALGQDTAAASSSRGASPFAKSGSRFVSTMGAVVSSDLKTARSKRSMLEASALPNEPSTSTYVMEKVVIPGDRLFPISDELRAGWGTYEMFGHVYASLVGIVHLVDGHEGEKAIRTVEVRRRNEVTRVHVVPYIGCIATAKVLNIGPRFAKCSILCVDSSVLGNPFNGILRKEDITTAEKEKTQVHLCVHPGDVILARVIGFGDSQTSFLLSTAEDQLGVVSGVGDLGERLVPISFNEVRSVVTGDVEPRKVAKVPSLNHYTPSKFV